MLGRGSVLSRPAADGHSQRRARPLEDRVRPDRPRRRPRSTSPRSRTPRERCSQPVAANKGLKLEVTVDADQPWRLGDPVRIDNILVTCCRTPSSSPTAVGSAPNAACGRGPAAGARRSPRATLELACRPRRSAGCSSPSSRRPTRRFGGTGLGLWDQPAALRHDGRLDPRREPAWCGSSSRSNCWWRWLRRYLGADRHRGGRRPEPRSRRTPIRRGRGQRHQPVRAVAVPGRSSA